MSRRRWRHCGSDPHLSAPALDLGRDLARPAHVNGWNREVEVLVPELQAGRAKGGVGWPDGGQAVEADLDAISPVAPADRGPDRDIGDVAPAEAQRLCLECVRTDHEAWAHCSVRGPSTPHDLDCRIGDDDHEHQAKPAGDQDEAGGDRSQRQGDAKHCEREPAVAQTPLEGLEDEIGGGLHARMLRGVGHNQAPMTDDPDRNFRAAVALSRLVDPMPTLRALARNTSLDVDDVVHHALVRYASDGAEALLSIEPWSLRELIAARHAGDWEKVGSIIDWLEAGLRSDHWR